MQSFKVEMIPRQIYNITKYQITRIILLSQSLRKLKNTHILIIIIIPIILPIIFA